MKIVALTDGEIERIAHLLLNGDEPGDFRLARQIAEGRRDAVPGEMLVESKVVEHRVERAT